MSRRICEGVTLVGGAEQSDPADCLCYGLDLGVPVLIDCGCGPGWPRIEDNLRASGIDPAGLSTLVLTHAHIDHIGAAPKVVALAGCTVVAHALDADAIESGDEKRTAADWYGLHLTGVRVDRRIDGERSTLSFPRAELHLLHTPGHTPGSMVAWLDGPDGRILFGQDIHGPFHPAFGSDVGAWRTSMQTLLELEADILCEGHLGVFRGQAEVAAFIRDHLARHRA